MCTHLHWDHVGWNTRLVNGQWVPTFPNAKYIMAKREYDYWDGVYPRKRAKATTCTRWHSRTACCRSCAPRGRSWSPTISSWTRASRIEPCHGHSPGHVVVNVASGGKKGVFIGDVIHHPMQLLYPGSLVRADFDMDASRVSRNALIEKHADTGTIVMPQHFATPSCGTIKRKGSSFAFEFLAGS